MGALSLGRRAPDRDRKPGRPRRHARLRRLPQSPAQRSGGSLGLASEACLSLSELVRQNRRRLAHLLESPEPALARFLVSDLGPLLDRLGAAAERAYRAAGMDPEAELAVRDRVLSPSDFGFHNMLVQPGGDHVFLDFEYFGWDDPAKLAADVAWHPAMALAAGEAQRFNERMTLLLGDDRRFPARLAQFLPLIGIRWCLIVLNEFLPERWVRRQHAGTSGDWEAAKARQLAKAHAILARVAADWPSSGDASR
jgi:hypothetical protein